MNPIIQPVFNYIDELRKITTKSFYEGIYTQNIKTQNDYVDKYNQIKTIDNVFENLITPQFGTIQIPIEYKYDDINNPPKLPSKNSDLQNFENISDKIKSNIIYDYLIDKSESKIINYNNQTFPSLLIEKNLEFLEIKKENGYKKSEFENIDFSKLYNVNSLEFDINTSNFEDGFIGLIDNMSSFLNTFVEKVDNFESYSLIDPLDRMTLSTNNINNINQQITSSVDFDKLNKLGKKSISQSMISTMDNKQFSLLMNNLEKNSNLISESLKKSKSETNNSSTTNVVTIQPTNKNEKSKDNTDKLIKIMSSLDDKMSIMILSLNSISSKFDVNRNVSTSLRPYKHF